MPFCPGALNSPEFGEHGHAGDERLILRIRGDDGSFGLGESPLRGADAVGQALGCLREREESDLQAAFADLWSPEELYWQRPVSPSPYAPPRHNLKHRLRHPMQTAVEMALTDWRARRLGLPLCHLLGGPWRDRISVDFWMGRVTPEEAGRRAERAVALGFSGLKCKTALEDPNVERLMAIRDVAGPEFGVTVDPNGRFYRLADAWPTIREMDRVGNLAILEDPFPRDAYDQFAELRPRIDARLACHLDPLGAFGSALRSGAPGAFNLDSHTGGLFEWRSAAAAAEYANLAVWHGSGLDLGVATAAQLHLAASAPNCTLPGDQASPWLREHMLVNEPFALEGGALRVPTGPGLGVTLDEDALGAYATRTWE